jgi:DNA primase
MNDTIREIKEKLSIVDVVLPYVKLTKAGKSWKGLSPFTKEKTPSFFVSPDRGTYYCFSTHQGGDIFTFIEKMEGVDFKGALALLAQKAGVSLRPVSREERDAREDIFEALAFAEQFFHKMLLEEKTAQNYVHSRGIEDDAIRSWRIGYAKDEWRLLMEAAREKGFSRDTLLAAGLIKEAEGKQGTFYDRFRNRIVFPLRNTAGRTIAFSGRALRTEEDIAKYLNSPETSVFKKSEVLYGFDRARESIRTRGYAIVVEGQIDLVLSHQSGLTNTVALSGTAFTETQLTLLGRVTKNLLLALDQDRAGLASMRAITIQAYGAGMDVKIVPLPEGSDPADILSKDKDAFTRMMRESMHSVDFFTAHLLNLEKDRHKLLRRVEQELFPLIGAIQSPLMKSHALERVSQTLSISLPALAESLSRSTDPGRGRERVYEVSPQDSQGSSPPIHFLAALVKVFPESDAAGSVMKMCTTFNILLPEDIDESILFEVERMYETPPGTEEGREIAESILREYIRGILSTVAHDIRRAEMVNDTELLANLSQKTQDLTRALKGLSNIDK